MTLFDLIHNIKEIALKLPNVRTFAEGSIYDVMNGKNGVEYDAVVISQDTHRADESFNYFTFNIFYISRLLSDMEENRLQVQSLGIEVLNNLFNLLSDKYDIEVENDIQYNSFTQKFVDECCGVYASLVLNVPKDFMCSDDFFTDTSKPIISIKNVSISQEYTENGYYNITYDNNIYTGIENVKIKVAVDYTDEVNSAREEGYKQGNYDGYNRGYTEGDANGYNRGSVEGYNNGLEVGKEEQKSLLEQVTITENGTYSKEDGYNEVIVEVPDLNGSYDEGYQDGYDEGKEEQKSLLTSITITKSGTYTREDGYNEVIVTSEDKPVVPNGIKFNGSYATFKGILPSEVWTKNDWSNFYDCDGLFKDLANITDFNIDDFSTIGLIPYLSTIDMFNYCWYLEKIPQLDTSNVVLMNYMFKDCHRITTIPELDTSNVVNMSNMFNSCEYLTTIPELDTSKVTNMSGMFYNCDNLTTIPQLNTSKVTYMNTMFNDCDKLTTIPELDTSNVVNMSSMFNSCEKLTTIPQLNTSKVTDMSRMFYGCESLTTIPELDTSNVVNMSNMFNTCINLTTIPQLNTSKVTDMTSMFATCPKLKNIELNVSNATNLSNMFANANGIENIKIYNIDKVTNMSKMFYGAVYYIKEITFTGNPSNLTNVSSMFGGNSTPDGFTLYYDNRYNYNKIIEVLPNKCTAIPITIE